MSASPISHALFKAFTTTGTMAPLAFGKLWTYAAGTVVPLATYTDATGASAASNPIILDANGEATVWVGPAAYKFNLLDASDVQQPNWPQDGITSGAGLAAAAETAAKAFATAADTAQSVILRAEIPAQTGTFFTTTGTSTAYTLSPTVPIVAKVAGQRYNVKFHVASGATPTLAISGQIAGSLKQYDSKGVKATAYLAADQIADVEWDGTDYLVLTPLAPDPLTPKARETVYGGPVDTSGNANFLPATLAGLTLTTQNVTASAPLYVGASNGPANTYGLSSANLSWVLPDNATSYLFVDVSASGVLTTGSTVLGPVFQTMGVPSITLAQNTFNIAEMKMYCGTGSVAAQVNRVFVGKAVTAAGAITSTVAFAYNGEFTSPLHAFPGVSTTAAYQPQSHKIGVIAPRDYKTVAVCISADNGYAIGDEVPIASFGTYFSEIVNSTYITCATSSVASAMVPYTGGVIAAVAEAKWNLKNYVKRGW